MLKIHGGRGIAWGAIIIAFGIEIVYCNVWFRISLGSTWIIDSKYYITPCKVNIIIWHSILASNIELVEI